MNKIFVSGKREDEPRVGRLLHALEGAGRSVCGDDCICPRRQHRWRGKASGSANGRQMAGSYRNLVTGEAGPVSLVR